MRWFPFAACLCLAGPASAVPSASLQWNSCSDAAPRNLDYAGPGVVTQIISLHGFAGTVRGVSFEMVVRGPAGFPDAWRCDPVGCNVGGATIGLGSLGASCPPIGAGTPSITAYDWDPGTGVARVRFSAVLSAPATLDSTRTYVLGRVRYDQGACPGTDQPMCFELVSAVVLDPDLQEQGIPLANATVTWQDPQQLFTCTKTSVPGARVQEFMASCEGDTVPQFVELRSTQEGGVYSSALRLRVLDHGGGVRLDRGDLFGAAREGKPWPNGSSWLCASRSFELRTGSDADLRIPAALDSMGGRIELYEPGTGVVHGVDFGPMTPGVSLHRQLGDFVSGPPSPRLASGATVTACTAQPPGNHRVEIMRMGRGCVASGTPGFYIELRARGDQQFFGSMHLRGVNGVGTAVQDVPNLFPSKPDSTWWPGGRSWLIASSEFEAATGVVPDRVLEIQDAVRYELYGGPSGMDLIDSVHPYEYGGANRQGTCLRKEDSTYVVEIESRPTNFAGEVGGPPCFCPGPGCFDSTTSGFRIEEFTTACANGNPEAQYVVLRAMTDGLVAHHGLRFLQDTPFYQLPEGSPIPKGTAWLVACNARTGHELEQASGVVPDAFSRGAINPRGGTFTLFDDRLGGGVIDEVRFGLDGPVPSPRPGEAIRRDVDRNFTIVGIQEPWNALGAHAPVVNCSCGTNWTTCGSTVESTAPAASRDEAGGHAEYDMPRGMMAVVAGPTNGAQVHVADAYRLDGPTPGVVVPLEARLHVTGQAAGACSLSTSYPYSCFRNGGDVAFESPTARATGKLGDATDRFFVLPLTVRTGEPFALAATLTAYSPNGGAPESASFRGRIEFANVPAGMVVHSCAGYDATPALPSLRTFRVESGRVFLAWAASSDVVDAIVERTEDGATFVIRGTPVPGSEGLEFDDEVVTGTRYGYRLSWAGGTQTTATTWIEVPGPPLSLRALGSPGTPQLEFTLPTPARVRIEMLDLRGRRVSSRDLGMQAMGAHRVATPGGMRAGVYWARLLVGDEVRQLKLVVL